jgi:hypothetical protein
MPRECGDYLIDDRIGFGAYLRVGRVLNRMGHEDARRFGQSKRSRLHLGGVHKDVSRHNHGRLAIDFEPD